MGSALKRRDDIQGLRAVAVLAVIIFHINEEWLPGGFVGVDLFFVISGYLITKIIVSKKELNGFSFTGFYINRIRRIVPAYLLMLTVVTLFMAILLIPRDFEAYWESLGYSAYFNSNSFFANYYDYFGPEAYELPLLHTWSLAVEMQFYLFFPFLIFWAPKKNIKTIVFVLGLVALIYSSWSLYFKEGGGEYFSLIARAPEFLIGSMIALTDNKKEVASKVDFIPWVGLALVVASFAFVNEDHAFPGLLALPATVGVALIIYSPSSRLNKLLASRGLVFIGALSYSLYLWHWPILAAFRYYYESYTLSFAVVVAAFFIMLAMAYASYVFVETKLKGPVSLRQSFYMVPLAVALTVVFFASSHANEELVGQLPVELTRYAPASEICHGKIVADCIRGNRHSELEILMIGDSHAGQLNHFADVIGGALDARIRVITASACVTIPGFDYERIKDAKRKSCVRQINEAKKYWKSADGIILAGMWAGHAKSKKFLNSLDLFFETMHDKKINVAVLAQVPMVNANVQRVYRLENLGLSPMVTKKSVAETNEIIKGVAKNYTNIDFFDMSGSSIFLDAPFYDGKLIYHDNHHLNEVGSYLYGHEAITYLTEWISSLK